MPNTLSDTLSFHGEALKLRAERQRVLAANIANADTPNFKAMDFDFKTALQDATSGLGSSAVALVTDGRFSGVSTGACIGHIGPEALHGGPIGRVRDGDLIEIVIDRAGLTGSIDLVGAAGQPLERDACAALLAERGAHPGLTPHAALPEDTRLWAALQRASGGTWAGCVYDVDRIVAALEAGLAVLDTPSGGAS